MNHIECQASSGKFRVFLNRPIGQLENVPELYLSSNAGPTSKNIQFQSNGSRYDVGGCENQPYPYKSKSIRLKVEFLFKQFRLIYLEDIRGSAKKHRSMLV